MYLSELKLWNFRKYGIKGESLEQSEPGISIKFNQGLNVLIGENDSGKSTIIDAIRYSLGTQSGEYIRFDESDFHYNSIRTNELRIECIFRGFSDEEAGRFIEWIGTEETDNITDYVLTIRITARNKGNRIYTDFRAGQDPIGSIMDGDAKSLLRTTYLKPLRDADSELTPGRRSRFAQILKAHSLFLKTDSDEHELEKIFNDANSEIEKYFKSEKEGKGAFELMEKLNKYIEAFFPKGDNFCPLVKISGGDLFDILKRLSLSLDTNPSGLGSSNLLFMATELLLLQSDENLGLKLALIEELEAHLHPQAQLRLIKYLEEKSITGQYILTTHSTTMGSSVPLENLIICKNDKAFPMGPQHTKLIPEDYDFLYRFLDATKANLFFARGILLVEGDAENLFIPTIAKIIDRPLHKYGVSIINIGSTAFTHYLNIFERVDGQSLGINVAMITDLDAKPFETPESKSGKEPEPITPRDEGTIQSEKKAKSEKIAEITKGDVKGFVSPNWTLEYEIALSKYRDDFYYSILWAEKIENSKKGEPREGKKEEVKEKVKRDIENWAEKYNEDPQKNEKIAFEIYKNTMLDKKISKAITAQVFAQKLEKKFNIESDKEKLKEEILSEPNLKYITDAIFHVTERELPEQEETVHEN